MERGALCNEGGYPGEMLRIRYKPPKEYDLCATFRMLGVRNGDGDLVASFPFAGREMAAVAGSHGNRRCFIEGYDNTGSRFTDSFPLYRDNTSYRLRIEVRAQTVSMFLDDVSVAQCFLGDHDKGIPGRWVPGENVVGLGTFNKVAFHELKLYELKGTGSKVDLPTIGDAPSVGRPAPELARSFKDLMPLIDPDRDAINGKWTKDNRGLRSESIHCGRLRIPYMPPEEYDFRVKFTRDTGMNDVALIASANDHKFLLGLGGFENTISGFAMVDGHWIGDNPTTFRAPGFLRNGRQYTAVVHVRKDRIMASLDGQLVGEPLTADNKLSLPIEWDVGEGILGVGSENGDVAFDSIEIGELNEKGKVVTLPPPGDVPNLGKPALADKAERTVDLMQHIDPVRDAVAGKWILRDGTLSCDRAWSARLSAPYQPPDEYDLHVDFERVDGFDLVNLYVSHNGHNFVFSLGGWDNTCVGFGHVSGRSQNENPTTVKSPGIVHNGRRYSVIVHVRKERIAASVDGQLVTDYPTDCHDLDFPADLSIADGVVGVGSRDNTTLFHKFEVAEIAGQGKLLRESGTRAAAAVSKPLAVPEAMQKFPKAQVYSGEWKIVDGELARTSTTAGSAKLVFGDPDWSDYNFTVKAKALPGKSEMGVLFGFKYNSKYRVFELGTKGNKLNRLQSKPGDSPPTQTKEGGIEANRWYEIRIEARGPRCRCVLDGVEIFVGEADENRAQGRVGLEAWRREARFKDIKVTSADDKIVLWQGLPEIPDKAQEGAAKQAALPEAMQKFPKAEVLGGHWTIEGRELAQSSTTDTAGSLSFGDPSWSRYDLTFRGKSDGGLNGFSVGWHVQGPRDKLSFRTLLLGGWNNTRHGLRMFTDGMPPPEGQDTSVAGDIDRSRWYDVRCRGARRGMPLLS